MIKSLKKITIGTALMAVIVFSAPLLASAQTTSILAPELTNVQLGEQFSVVVSVDAQNVTSYAEKIKIAYPADALEVFSFTFEDSWTPLAKEGYEATDDAKGILTRTAAFPGGFTGMKKFGTIIFVAKKNAAGTIHLENGSFSYEDGGQSALSGGSAQFSITVPSKEENVNVSNLGASVISTGFLESAQTFFLAISIMSVLILLFTAFPSKIRNYLFKLK